MLLALSWMIVVLCGAHVYADMSVTLRTNFCVLSASIKAYVEDDSKLILCLCWLLMLSFVTMGPPLSAAIMALVTLGVSSWRVVKDTTRTKMSQKLS